ncbi:MAG: glycoside hydrolase, partial [Prosthecobacter sp.]|nr:glycoside hydrolase [Prosthecobacter sp.]
MKCISPPLRLTALCALAALGFSPSLLADSAVVLETRVISTQPQFYHGWPTLTRRADGGLWLAWSGGRDSHVCPFGQVWGMTSRDEGKTWTFPQVLLDSATDDRDAGALETARGTLLITTFTSLAYEPVLKGALGGKASPYLPEGRLDAWKAAHARLNDDERKAELGQWLIRSTDGGRTWSSRIPTIVNSPHGPIQLKDGRLLYAGKELWTQARKIGVCESKDDGQSWQWLAEIPTRPGDDATKSYHELHAVEAADGTLLAHIRNHNPENQGETLQSESRDGGKTWSVPHPIGVWGLPSHLLRLRDGRLLMTYGHRRPPFGNQARVSSDHGKTWGEPILLSGDGKGGDLGYPSTVELSDGTLLTVWYESMVEPRPAVLRQARWRLPPPEAPNLQRFVAIDNICAWPNLTLLPDGSIHATVFGKPSHGQIAGSVQSWKSLEGELWEKVGIPAPHEPDTNRMNVAAGLAKNGDLLVLCSGWTNQKQPQRPKQADFRDDILPIWICRSPDGGKTWTQTKSFPAPDPGWTHYIPFGDIKSGADGALHVSCYAGEWVNERQSTKTKSYRAWHFRSEDDGATWRRTAVISPQGNETTLLHLGGKNWLAASRRSAVEMFFSEDDGSTWTGGEAATAKNEINGHLLRLNDGRVLLSYGSRVVGKFGVLARISNDL